MRFHKKLLAWAVIIALVVFLVIAGIGKYRQSFQSPSDNETNSDAINIGILFSETGTSSLVEKSMINAAKLAFDEINENGGVNGRKINYIVADYSSNPKLAKDKITELITEYNVSATVGCYSSASRQATLPVLEKYNSLLIYPTYTEGEEIHPNVIYTGAMPNQQATEYIPWLMEKCGKKVFLIGSDYIFPVTCNKQAKRIIDANGGEICGELYVPVGSIDFESILDQIREADPDFIYCDLIGDSVVSFYKQYYQKGFDSAECPIASITTDEMSLKEMGAECSEGTYASMNYFSSLDTDASKEFVKKYEKYVTDGTIITSLAEATYDSCYLLIEAMKKTDCVSDTDALMEAFLGLEFDAPQGKIKVDENNHCTWLYSRFAVVNDGKFNIVYESDEPIRPEPWPAILYPDKIP